MTIESGDGGLRGFRQDSNQQAAGSLRVEEKIAVFLRNAFGETHAIANEIAVILQAAGKKSFACGLNGSGKIANGGMIDLEGHGLNIPLRITERHLPGVAQQSESRNVRHCMNWSCSPCLVLYSF